MAAAEETKAENEHFDWNVENEIFLFEAMIGYKPVGVHKHFHMACICEKFETLLGKSVSPNIIWDHLHNMYDLAALDKKETMPFPNFEEEFTLPGSDFSQLIAEKLSKTVITNEIIPKEERCTAKTVKEPAFSNLMSKKDKTGEQEESQSESEKKDEETETEVKRGKSRKDEKPIGKRGKRNLKDKKNEDENSQVSTTNVKKGDDDSSTTLSNNKKGKRMIGKRSLRSRADETSTTKSSTPPPTKRARRI